MDKHRDLLDRLASLNGKPLENVPAPEADLERVRERLIGGRGAAPPIRFSRDAPPAASPTRPARALPGEPRPLEEVAPGAVTEAPPWGRAYVLTQGAHEACRYGAQVCSLYRERCAPGTPAALGVARPRGLEGVEPADLLFMDLETTGLSNTPVFLVGLMALEGEQLVIRQFLARTYAEEAAITALFVQALARYRVLVTFNGKTFDLPFMRVRAAATGVPFAADVAHLDLLHECRRAWPRRVPNHRLQTLERWICGRERVDDLPGSEVPEVYHAYVRSGDAREIGRVLEHNRRDLVTLADLLCCLPDEHWRPPGDQE